MTPDLLHTGFALLLAHAVGDYLLQTGWIVANKRKFHVLLLHGAVIGLCSLVALGVTGSAWQAALAVMCVHVAVDAAKVYLLPETLLTYLMDQAAHILAIIAIALWVPGVFASGLWAAIPPDVMEAAIIATGLIFTTMAGGPAVGLLMQRFGSAAFPDGLENAGRMIGMLERGLIFLMVLIDQPAGIGFLIAAKSVLRFDTASQDQKAGEYVIIGTLASFGWAMGLSFATKGALVLLTP